MKNLIEKKALIGFLIENYKCNWAFQDLLLGIDSISLLKPEDLWVLTSERFPTEAECLENNYEFLVCTDDGMRFVCQYDSLSNGYDTPKWAYNGIVIA